MSEAETRKRLVEKVLLKTGWGPIVDYVPRMSWGSGAVREYETDNGPADYILFHDGVPLAVVESKRLSLSPQNVLIQAQRYSRGFRGGPFNFEGFRVPFVYSTNGALFWFQDLREVNSRSRKVATFHTHTALQEFLSTERADAADWLRGNPNTELGLRPYQREAVDSIENALLQNRRTMLVAMATGTGFSPGRILLYNRFNSSLVFMLERSGNSFQPIETKSLSSAVCSCSPCLPPLTIQRVIPIPESNCHYQFKRLF